MPLHDLPAAMRPREKLLAQGAAALGDAELLALLLRTGMQGKNVLVLAQELLTQFDGVAGLLQARLDDLKTIKGLGPAKRAELAAVLELARRALNAQLKAQPLRRLGQALQVRIQKINAPVLGFQTFKYAVPAMHQMVIHGNEHLLGIAGNRPQAMLIKGIQRPLAAAFGGKEALRIFVGS